MVIMCALDALLEPIGMLYLFVIVPIISFILIVYLVVFAIRKRPRQFASALAVLAIYGLSSFGYLRNRFDIRNIERWSLRSRQYKAEVLSQPDRQDGEFKHIDWDGWGFAGAGDTTVYLIFDPADSLDAAAKNHRAGKFAGIPCTVLVVNRLEKQWYAVEFYTDEHWGKPRTDCDINY